MYSLNDICVLACKDELDKTQSQHAPRRYVTYNTHHVRICSGTGSVSKHLVFRHDAHTGVVVLEPLVRMIW